MPRDLIDSPEEQVLPLPSWFKQDIPDANNLNEIKGLLDQFHLNTVCQAAHCPNIGKCFAKKVATFMILGEVCTRDCLFCAVEAGQPGKLDKYEPQNVALAVRELGLKYVVVTSVTRDDLPDKGAAQFASTIKAIRKTCPETKVEILIPDFNGETELLKMAVDAAPEVIAHNIEMVKRLYPSVRPRADYSRSLKVLAELKNLNEKIIAKTGFMVGLGETDQEIRELIFELAQTKCDILTVGQYLSPSASHAPVRRFVAPEDFEKYKTWGREAGFKYVFSTPLARSSFMAEEGYNEFKKIKCN